MNFDTNQDILNKLKNENEELKKKNEELVQSNKLFKKTQTLLLESEEKFRNVFNLSPTGILILDNDNKIQMFNDGIKEILGKTNPDIKGRSVFEFISNSNNESIALCRKKLATEGICKNVNFDLIVDNHIIPIRADVANLMNNSGQPFGKMAIFTKESEGKQIEIIQKAYQELLKDRLEDYKNLDNAKDEFISMASHELKTPLFPIKFQTKTLLEEIYGKINDEQKNSLEEINSNCMKLERLILNLLNIQKNNLEGTPFDLQNIDLKKFMNEVYLENKTFFENSGIEFTNETSDTIFFRSDPHKLKQIFRNLITNSIDFVSDKNGKIQISATHENNSITFLVKDNGVGIAKKDLDNIFKKFHKVNTSITRKYGGAGLGLSICKEIIESLNGKISIQSTLGKDTTVYFQIPFENSNLKIQNPGVEN